jgi:arylsulfatase A-like enzyme/Flp pilus assembly protein TadD
MPKKNKKKARKIEVQKAQPATAAPYSKRSVAPYFIAVILIVGVISFLLFRHNFGRKAGSGAFVDRNVLLITIDTLRADHLPIYGYTGVQTPTISHLAESSFVFQDAIAQVPLTLPSHTSILTGLLPVKHGVRDNGTYVLDQKITTLAEILKSHGFTTAAFVSSAVLDSRQHLDQGFDFYFDNLDSSGAEEMPGYGVERHAADTEKEAEEWVIANKDKKFFLWVHFYDPHDPYKPPEPFKTEYATHPYDGEIAYTDQAIGKLFTKLEALQTMQKTIVIITGDHGESLGEHGEPNHGIFLYDCTLRVPLLIHVPDGTAKRIPDLVRHVDIAPTILDWLGIPADPGMQGKSLIPLIEGKEKQKRLAYSESKFGELHYGWSPLESMTSRDFKYIDAPRAELYARKKDPGELNNLIKEKDSIAKQLNGQLQDILKSDSTQNLQSTAKVDPEMEEKLRALGYVGTTVQSTPESRKTDPKDKIYLHRNLSEALAAVTNKNYERAIEKLEPLLKENPKENLNIVEAHYLAGIAYGHLQRYPDAIKELATAIQLRPDQPDALFNLAYAYQVTGHNQEAEFYYKAIFKYQKDYLPAIVGLTKLYRATNQTTEADIYFHKAIDAYQESLGQTKGDAARSRIYTSLAEIYFSAGDLDHAEQSLRTALELTPQQPTLHYNLAQMYEAKRDVVRAIDEYKKEIEVDPSNYMAHNNLALLYRQTGHLNEARESFRTVLKIIPGDLQASYYLAETELMSNQNLDEALTLARHVVQAKPDFQQGRELLAAIEKRMGK